MKLRSVKTLVLTEDEVTEAVILWLRSREGRIYQKIAGHMDLNRVSVDTHEEGFAFDMDGMWEEPISEESV
tara:strand:+ start:32467 stop:32679 length:213 start_codon:yes stop_codon:yes gene_type:complete